MKEATNNYKEAKRNYQNEIKERKKASWKEILEENREDP